jgi:hypothetical protein
VAGERRWLHAANRLVLDGQKFVNKR